MLENATAKRHKAGSSSDTSPNNGSSSSSFNSSSHLGPSQSQLLRNETVILPKFPAKLSVSAVQAYRRDVETYEMSGQYSLNRSTSITKEQKCSIQTLLDSSEAEEAIRKDWEDNTKVPTHAWLGCLMKLLENSKVGMSDTELFRTALAKNPFQMNMMDTMQTISSTAIWSTKYDEYDASVCGELSVQTRKQQISSLEQTFQLINNGPGAKEELKAFFQDIRNRGVGFKECLQEICKLHMRLNQCLVEAKRWYDLSNLFQANHDKKRQNMQTTLSYEDNKKHPRGRQLHI
jgi:hypothetical protein